MDDLESIRTKLQRSLISGVISGRLLLDRMRLLDESSRKSAAYADHRYAPFYYHLGKFVSSKSMIEVGFNLGLLGCCFLKSCKTVERYLGFQQKSDAFYSPRLGIANIRDNHKGLADIYVGEVTDEEFTQKISPNSWDLVIINEEVGFDKHLLYLDVIWPYVSEQGIIVSEYIDRHTPAREAFDAFCKSKNRVSMKFDTRYGTALVQK
jgi:hypothetical protein